MGENYLLVYFLKDHQVTNKYVRNMCGPYILAYTNVYAIPEKVCKGGFGYSVMTIGKLTQTELTPDPLEL